jgi:hypothetical protein
MSSSSAQYIVTGIQRHKLSVLVSLIVVVAGIIGIGAYLRGRIAMSPGTVGIFSRDDPVWDPIRSDPRFIELMRRMGIP